MKTEKGKATLRKKVRNDYYGYKMFLLGKGANGEEFYLNEASWDCGWYWGFGYVKTFEKKCSNWSRHSHIKDDFIGQQKEYDYINKKEYLTNYVHNIYDNVMLVETTFSREEGNRLSILFNEYYHFRRVADMLHNNESFAGGDDMRKTINEVYLPKIFKEIEGILEPESKK